MPFWMDSLTESVHLPGSLSGFSSSAFKIASISGADRTGADGGGGGGAFAFLTIGGGGFTGNPLSDDVAEAGVAEATPAVGA